MSDDRVARTRAEWHAVKPELDTASIEITLRVLLLGKQLEHHIARSLAPFGLQPWEFDVLAALRRQDAPYRLPAGELARRVVLTCSGMTHRVSRLEERALVQRIASDEDRRSVFVELTDAGIDCVDRAVEIRAREGARLVDRFSDEDRATLIGLLKRLEGCIEG